MKSFNLKPLHKRVGNWIVTNEKNGGYFYLNVCDYLKQYDEEIPTSCTGIFLFNIDIYFKIFCNISNIFYNI